MPIDLTLTQLAYTIRDTGVFFMSRELQAMNQRNKLALWAGRISECRNSGMAVKTSGIEPLTS